MISQKDETVEGSVWFDHGRQTPERKEALDNSGVIKEEEGSSIPVFPILAPYFQALKAILPPVYPPMPWDI
ncbi:hypothetical protein SERLA73DRAFT_68774 [Serpula lacrymans var. lacrymans S7.3]|uniref:Uncharacterized protein n=1 Tax=Serpula lacrymans var. lacrymans (strain S7.3) TaxID=936435 RepID=F8PI94_SERL3|nr:hypothetical protein SERLA73DRAFT_68774 [Serpula lacrymans var. lacrymans S7.3]